MRTTKTAIPVLLALVLAGFSAVPAYAQRGGPPAAPPNPFEGIKTLKCTFTVASHGTWPSGTPTAQVKSAAVLTFQLVDIDVQESTAQAIGLSTTTEVVAQLRGWNLHFLDVRSTGGLMLTTVFGQTNPNGTLKAAYTRADYLPIAIPGFSSTPEVSQHYGECEIGK